MDANTLALVKDALDHGVDPNAPIQKGRYLDSAIGRASQLADPGDENAQARALTVLKLLLEAGARIGEGDIARRFSYSGNEKNIQPVFETLISHSSLPVRQEAF